MNAGISSPLKLCIALLSVTLALPVTIHSYDNDANAQKQVRRFQSAFRYAIVSNDIVNTTGDTNDAFRYVGVLLDEKAFSEHNLKALFKLVSARFRTPDRLEVQVYTSLDQVETPEERDYAIASESPDDPKSDKHHWALFIRSIDNELFRYNPNPPHKRMKTIVLKGRDPTDRKY